MDNIWKLTAEDPDTANEGEFCFRYMLSVLMNKTLYLGQCSCAEARYYNTPIIAFRPRVPCVFCDEEVELQPVPRVEAKRKWTTPGSDMPI